MENVALLRGNEHHDPVTILKFHSAGPGPERTMEIMPIDITGLIATILGISIVLVPVIGVTARFALSPTVEALSRLFETRGANETMQLLERRIELQEQEISALQQAVRGLSEARDFDRQLQAPGQPDTDAGRQARSSGHASS
jgi:hypothetical protein